MQRRIRGLWWWWGGGGGVQEVQTHPFQPIMNRLKYAIQPYPYLHHTSLTTSGYLGDKAVSYYDETLVKILEGVSSEVLYLEEELRRYEDDGGDF